ncbi:cytochrome P450 [Sphingomonas sp. SUN039]|uniref:cytochrome P450 n=1 Tax=Sphingomonas sp. SUN039 TaxID=2937787 RepID=UPI002164426C|nr:cytochrome P450 [Sphingomonas sp. SUN039]UVO54355.1 cytochrome P450 [Sphingomonas sp. SUN039]
MAIPRLAIDPFDEAFLADPYAHHDALRDAGPVVYLEPIRCFAMARHCEVVAALKDWPTYVSARGVGLSDFATEAPWRPPSLLLEADPPLHDRTRGLMNKVASLASLRDMMPGWRAKAEALVERLVARRHVDAVADLAEAFPLSVFPDLIGLREEGREHLIPYGATAFNAFGPRNRLYDDAMARAAEATAWVMDSCRREHLRPGGWGALVYAAADRGECTEAEAERLVRSFLTAGVDTTVNGIGNMLYAFAQHPEQWRKLREDPLLARKAFEESLRWGGTVQTFFRTTSSDIGVERETIPEGSKVLLFLAAANRDPRQWQRADRFDIARSASGHVGFGFGIHQCLGQMVARMEAEALLAALVPRVAEIRLAGAPVRRLNNTLHALASLPVELVPANGECKT